MKKNFKYYKSAFTLAEVLITLGIIGVVAAITIPMLIHNSRAIEMRTRLLRANSIIQNGIGRMVADEVDVAELMGTRDYGLLRKYFKDGGCAVPKNASEGKYTNYYGDYSIGNAAAQKIIWPPYCLADGMLLWFATLNEHRSAGGWTSTSYTVLLVDINGLQGRPNKYGQDVFFWVFNPDDGRVHPFGKSVTYVLDNIASSDYYKYCPGSKRWAEAGIGCTETALSDEAYFKRLKF